ncbi:MAG: DUF429 domain-containing protein [Haloarculaceae archaeon]
MGSRVLGVDFSGASDAGEGIWLTEAAGEPDGLSVTDCFNAGDRWGTDRQRAHGRLREYVADEAFDVVAVDAPFSLPKPVLEACCGGHWAGLVEWVGGDGGPDDAVAFAEQCRDAASETTGDTDHLRRETDFRRGALCPYDVRTQYQTYWGVRNVIGPLARTDGVAVAPMQDDAETVVIEAYPAATFGWLGLYREGYKGDDGARDRRATNVEGIEACSVDLDAHRELYTSVHDALDSLAAAVTAGRVADGARPDPHGPRSEGHIYV